MSHKKLGILGGMGPMATSVFFSRLIQNTEAKCDQDHVDMLIMNHASLPDRTKSIQLGEEKVFLEAVLPDLKVLEYWGASSMAIPCNTSHYFIEDLQKKTSVPIINMVYETAKVLKKSVGPYSKIGVLATSGTIEAGVYKKELEKFDLTYVAPSASIQMHVMDIIYGIKSGKSHHASALNRLIKVMLEEEGCSAVILACTELSLVDIDKDLQNYCVDAMDILVQESLRRCGKGGLK